MMTMTETDKTPKDGVKMGQPITVDEFSDILQETRTSRLVHADKEMDYYDGNQIGSER